ncbi:MULTISPECIES: hypothetical protein [unclassified Paenibacillus]|uniref:hypothetical protein n=1 Tax=unclassified Paenibacillus TaxID=185978 RepID=UPI001C105C49|nr:MULTISPECIES: hypothetical protein [unclassified Paenibacillus]MBU5442105.1 hypothetical protein [Paenibacillus sp. MSJ-34]
MVKQRSPTPFPKIAASKFFSINQFIFFRQKRKVRPFAQAIVENKAENDYNRGKPIFILERKRSFIMSTKRKPPTIAQKPKEEVNKKALIWVGCIFAALVIVVTLLLVFSNGS